MFALTLAVSQQRHQLQLLEKRLGDQVMRELTGDNRCAPIPDSACLLKRGSKANAAMMSALQQERVCLRTLEMRLLDEKLRQL